MLNDEDSCPAGDLNWVANAETDQDDDGCQDDSSEDLDDDNDSVLDDDDNCPLVTNTAQANHDNDEFGDVCDSDIDNDGVPNNEDACFAGDTGWTANSDTDGDGDGCRDDTEDLDDDNDGVEDSEDVCPAISDPYCTERVCGVVGTSYGVTSFDYGSDRYLVTINEYGERLISDSQTDLIWQGCEAGRAGDSCEFGVSDTYSYGDAFNYCDTLVLDGYDDWRLGSVHEVNSLIRYNNANPALQDVVFLDSNASFYFSSPLVSGASGAQIYTQQIADGAVTVMDMWDENNNELVTPLRCVRKNGTNHQYHDDSHCLYRSLSILTATGDGEPVVVQEKHDLMWQGCLSGFTGANCENGINDATEATLFSWSQANTHCEQLVWGGYSDWQLPDVHQLMGLKDFELQYSDTRCFVSK